MKKIGLGIFGGIILIGLLVLLYIKLTMVDTCMKDCLPNDIKNEVDNLQDNKTIVEIMNPIIQDALSEMNILKIGNNSYYNKDLNQVKKAYNLFVKKFN